MKVRTYVLFFALLIGTTAYAAVDMRLANYFDSWTDLELPGTGYNLRITRTYNSRSLFNGMFGFGWCSAFETQFSVQADGTIKLKECGDGRVTTYVPRNFSSASTKRVVSQIMRQVKRRNPAFSKAQLSQIQTELNSNSNTRQSYANRYGIKSQIRVGTVYYALGNSIETIVRKRAYYERSLPDGTKQRFDLSGRLTYLYDRNNNYIQLVYKGKLITIIKDNNNRQLVLAYYPNQKVRLITGPGRLKVRYKYSGNNLVHVTSAWNNSYAYTYDKLHNLTSVTYPDKTNKRITYNTNRDWVTSFKDRDGCLETYKYGFSPKNPKDHYWADVLKRCQKRIVTKARFEYWYKPRKLTVGKFLARSRSKVNNDTNDIFYSERFGRPVRSVINGQVTLFTYYPNGLLKTRKAGTELVAFKYRGHSGKVSEVKVGNVKTSFSYDTKGNMFLASMSTGQNVRLAYDKQGRILSLNDQAKREVKISYDNRFGKPKTIERPGVGALYITYKSNGDIKAVRNSGGPIVARQVASTFNNLLDIVSPAGIELNL